MFWLIVITFPIVMTFLCGRLQGLFWTSVMGIGLIIIAILFQRDITWTGSIPSEYTTNIRYIILAVALLLAHYLFTHTYTCVPSHLMPDIEYALARFIQYEPKQPDQIIKYELPANLCQ